MNVQIIRQVEKVLKKETEEIKCDIADILKTLESGGPLGLPHIKPLSDIHSNLYEISR